MGTNQNWTYGGQSSRQSGGRWGKGGGGGGAERERANTVNSCSKARDGHRYPCPALVFHDVSCYVSRAAAPEGTKGNEVL